MIPLKHLEASFPPKIGEPVPQAFGKLKRVCQGVQLASNVQIYQTRFGWLFVVGSLLYH